MAGLGRWPVPIPEQVQVIEASGMLTAQGPQGKQELHIDPSLSARVENGTVIIARREESRRAKALQGLTRRLVLNMIDGVGKGFTRSLEISGVGYRAEAVGNTIHLTLGFSHPIVYQLPAGVQAKVERQTVVTLEGTDRRLLGEVAAGIRRLRPPDPYKAKGVKYAGEQVRRKAGKTAGAR